MRLRIDLSYDGTDFRGWAIQPDLRTVQGTLETALATVLRVTAVSVVCAGRTDTGVHARGQVVHLDLPDPASYDVRLLRRLNGILPADVRVLAVAPAADGFDARYSALWRRYAYRVADEASLADPLTRHHVLAGPHPLDLDAMNRASEPLMGLQDFASFCRRREGATTVRTLIDLAWSRDETGVAVCAVRADAFCHRMVRSLVGCLMAVGEGRREPEWAASILTARLRDPSLKVAPARGLTLEEVCYPDADELAVRAGQARAKREAL